MKRLIYLILILSFFLYCGPKQDKIDKIIEDGVEVVINHLEPYRVEGEPSTLYIEEEFTIDTGRGEIADVGVTDINNFDVDSEGTIYFFQDRGSDENLVYKFDKNGNFMTSFGKRGQGPGEFQYPMYQNITKQDEIPIQDYGGSKLFIFDRNGTLVKETRLDSKVDSNFIPLENGNYLKFIDYFDPLLKHRYDILNLYNSKLEEIKELDRIDYGPGVMVAPKKKGTPRVFIYKVSDGMIYLGHENRGYEILIYDLDGNLLKKIKKGYNPIDVPDEFKEIVLVNFGRYKDKVYFPNKMPPFHYFFLDDDGRLYVKTYEKGKNKDEYMHDVFNADGIFIARKSMAGYGSWMGPGRHLNRAKAKNNRLYCIREKESGYKELVIYRMKWE